MSSNQERHLVYHLLTRLSSSISVLPGWSSHCSRRKLRWPLWRQGPFAMDVQVPFHRGVRLR